MVICFSSDCPHHGNSGTCSMFRFSKNIRERNNWERLCRRKDRRLKDSDRICSCHFKDGLKKNGPTIFRWTMVKQFDFPDPEGSLKRPSHRDNSSTEDIKKSKVSAQSESDENVDMFPVIPDHNYYCSSETCTSAREKLRAKINHLQNEVEHLEEQMKKLQLSKRKFTIEDIKNDEEKMLMYTSLPFDIFQILLNTLDRFDLNYYQGWKVKSISLADQLLLTLMKLNLAAKDLDLAERFQISCTTVANIFYTITCALHEILFEGILSKGMPSQRKCRGSMPASFSDFVSARASIDATEITQDIPGDLSKQSVAYSHYKSRHTVKSITAVAPNGAIVYASALYPGSTSDMAIVDNSSILTQFAPGDMILADKGFPIFDKLPAGVSLNIPPFLNCKTHFTKQEADLCYKIARARIHIERANERIKNFDILRHIHATLRPLSTKIFQLCCSLVNLQAPLLKEISEAYNM